MYSLTAHIAIDIVDHRKSTEILNRINKLLNENYDIEHTTIQFDI
jgi:Co/Zn/Cd efflux system component